MGQSMRRAMIALGLAEPDEPNDRPQRDERQEPRHHAERAERPAAERRPAPEAEARPTPEREPSRGERAAAGRSSGSTSRSATEAPAKSRAPQDRRRTGEYRAPVTPIKRAPSTSREDADDMRTITTVHPRSYNDAKSVGESFRDGTPVIMDLTDLGEAEAKRLVDFAAGLVYALHGSIERVTTTVFLLTPSYVEVVDNSAAGDTQEAAQG
ncbi:cell division protein SepF [Kocuria sp. JC486]|uniref:cell division protein SepF n=1 Tax=Kocuria sp. JC486 TaxID=1970736 RepID=UPI001422B4B5|nr:cell division protein SepF [Kocuria sp. JC486]NHU84404.1 cell division protein SepF [Kocuria sp. JC486]